MTRFEVRGAAMVGALALLAACAERPVGPPGVVETADTGTPAVTGSETSPPPPVEDELPRLAACVAPPGGFDDVPFAYEGGDLTWEHTLAGEVTAQGEGWPADLCFSRAVVGQPGFSDLHGALARWFEVDGWTVGVLGEGAPAPAVGDAVTVEIVDGAHGFEGPDFGGFRWTGPGGAGFLLIEDQGPDGVAAADPRWGRSLAYGAEVSREADACGEVAYRALVVDGVEVPYGGTATVGGATVVNSGAIEIVAETGECWDWWPGRVLVGIR